MASVSGEPSDLGTEEMNKRCDVTIELTRENHKRARNGSQIPLDYYLKLSRKRPSAGITPRQWEAGNKLYESFARANMVPSPLPLWEKISANAGYSTSNHRLPGMMEFWTRTIHAIGEDSFDAKLLVNVCCYGFLVKDLLNHLYPTSQHLMCRLREALDRLADIYGIPHSTHQ